MSILQMMCCCSSAVIWIVGNPCAGGDPPLPAPVVRRDWLIENACFAEDSVVVKFDGVCYFFSLLTSDQIALDDPPDDVFVTDAEGGQLFCNCWLCEDDIDPDDPIVGNPDDGAANCCPSDTGCTTFGSNTVNARIRVQGRIFVRTKCSTDPDPEVFVENSYSFNEVFNVAGIACEVDAGGNVTKPSQTWTVCNPPNPSTNPFISGAVTWDATNGMLAFRGTIANMPNMPGDSGGTNFRLEALGGVSALQAVGGGWGSYVTDSYRYNAGTFNECQTSAAASGQIALSLNTNQNYVECDLAVSVAVDNVGACP